ncbi:fibrobacter succinogenes major paralogous domain-containing protein [Cognataquiflexum aquatile]|uniref:fibrobacter succinogenes major paralogous domain-containing protein n=1 Tax=Cognataquiflexum aquatile TaxID=2249427 RepID=UPI0013002FF1|nr:fibrobacter succinogenes major paralogous domain-containing protein [Cognataquiflexum aquatile]
MKDSKSQSSGINTKKVSYKAYNTEDKFVVKVKYEVTSGPSQAKASIAIQINGKKKEFKAVPSGYTATFSIPLDKGWEKCDQVTFSITQKGLGTPISFSEDYNLIPVCNNYETFTDPRDGQVYKIVKIGDQTWFAENLNYDAEGSWCYDNDPENCEIYGRLYTWEAGLTACPEGWHLPSEDEWGKLVDFLGGYEIAGGKMKSISGWEEPNIGATNESGFSALPGGGRNVLLGGGGFWWSSTRSPVLDADWYEVPTLSLYSGAESAFIIFEESHDFTMFSCRCIKD